MSLIALDQVRQSRKLQSLTEEWLDRLNGELPSPEVLGWTPLLRDPRGEVVRWTQPRYRAFVGLVPGQPDQAYVDYADERRVYRCSIEELVLGLETGILPEPLEG